MNEGLDLKAFLENQAAEGKADSVGSFTVAREKALQKLAAFALPQAYDWVLKIVQAANIWRVPKMVVRQTRIATSFYFCPPRDQNFPSEAAIVGALENPALDHENPIHAIAMALRSLVQQTRLSFVLAVRQDGEMYKPIYAGDDVSALSPQSREAWSYLTRDGVRLTVSHFQGSESLTGRYLPTFSGQPRRDVEILAKLEERCFASAVPIDVDGRILGMVFPRGDYFITHRQRPLVLGRLAHHAEPRPRMESLQLLTGHVSRDNIRVSTSPSHPDQPWFLITGSDPRAESSAYRTLSGMLSPMGRAAKKKPEHRVSWTRQGVTVAHYQFEGFGDPETTFQLFVPADHLRTDLSGLEIERDRSQWAQHNAQAPLKMIADDLGLILGSPESRQALLAPVNPADLVRSQPTEEQKVQLDGSDESTFSGDILPEMPTLGLGALHVLGSASKLLDYLPNHSARLERWATVALSQITSVRDDLVGQTLS